jgi:uncharacterized protein (TIGR02118 family)
MIKVSVMYPAPEGSRFDWQYYLGDHLRLANRLLGDRGLVRIEIDRGLGSFPPGATPPFYAVGHLFFRSMDEMQSALSATAGQFIEDERRYAPVPSVVQISEVVETRS